MDHKLARHVFKNLGDSFIGLLVQMFNEYKVQSIHLTISEFVLDEKVNTPGHSLGKK